MSINSNTIKFNIYSNVTNIYIPDNIITNNEDYNNKYYYMRNLKTSYIGMGGFIKEKIVSHRILSYIFNI